MTARESTSNNKYINLFYREAPPGVYIARGLDEAINLVNKDLADKVESICIIGGSSVYKVTFLS